jgi:two-component sensor histidine kinase
VSGPNTSERTLILAPYGRDAAVAAAILREAGMASHICADIAEVCAEFGEGAGLTLIVEEILQEDDYSGLVRCIETQPAWSDFPVLVLTIRGAGLERNPSALRFTKALGNVSFLERPFHPTTLVSVVQTALRGRRRQYEARERMEKLRESISRQEADQQRLRLMVNELNHRVKNTLATVQSIVAQTLRNPTPPGLTRDTLTSRIVALSKAHDVLTNEQWAGADLLEIANQAALPFRMGLGDERVLISGPRVRLPPKTAIAVALALHELATNAVKYGALSNTDGHVEFSWTTPKGRAGDLTAVWREVDGPPVSPPTRTGFGTRLIERGLATDLNGQVTLAYPVDGVVCTIRARLDPEAEPASAPAPRSARPAAEAGVTRSGLKGAEPRPA